MTNGARRVGDHPVIRQGPTGDAFPGAKYDYAKQDGAMTDRVAPEELVERLTALEAKWRERVKQARENLPQFSHAELAATWTLEACGDELRTALSHSAPKTPPT